VSEYPALVISSHLAVLHENLAACGIDINIVTGQEDLFDFIRQYSCISLNSPVALSNLSVLQRYHSKLLKFIEETKIPLICLASEDNFSPVFLSRFKTVKKTPVILKREADNFRLVCDDFVEGNVTDSDWVRLAVSYYPLHVAIAQTNLSTKDKIRQIYL